MIEKHKKINQSFIKAGLKEKLQKWMIFNRNNLIYYQECKNFKNCPIMI